ncbi:hypothetical protein IAI10_16365 [Clostridium sp. 19966]|uniref:hypothetical protein n=1 Tax=Clostridium sp. 19966 TaxID=2768166 RepID=UPI0028E05604|nr:hypothetical protein [Clostridium sp. 19966]MDT8718242.1 hypothetical protein [Clostridium sp. 19966]
MNEGEKQKKKKYQRGEVVSFRLSKKLSYSDEIIDFINDANEKDQLNIELVNAIEVYIKYKKFDLDILIGGKKIEKKEKLNEIDEFEISDKHTSNDKIENKKEIDNSEEEIYKDFVSDPAFEIFDNESKIDSNENALSSAFKPFRRKR